MNNCILIHNNNTPKNIREIFDDKHVINFDYSESEYKSIDEYISKSIVSLLQDEAVAMVFIKDNLSSSYLELYGIRVAYHIRLSSELKEKRYAPIVILSDLDGYILNKLDSNARILFTKNIFLEPNNIRTIEKYEIRFNTNQFDKFDEHNYKREFLDLIQVHPPENSTNHSIANEWAVYKWAKELSISDAAKRKTIDAVIERIANSLYFKYLRSLENIQDTIEINSPKFKKVGTKSFRPDIRKDTRALYIDDEWDNGWKEVFDFYFSTIIDEPPETLLIDYSTFKYEQVESLILEKIRNYKPDLLLLDIRIVADDNEKKSPEEYSGMKLLNKIKSTSLQTELNPGIQVIMFSATSKSIILDVAYKNNKILGYIKKDSPDNNTFSTKENIIKFTQLIEESQHKFYLKNIWGIHTQIQDLDVLKRENFSDVKNELHIVFNILNSNIESSTNFVIFAFTKSLEFISQLFINEYDMEYIDTKEKVGIYDFSDNRIYDYKNEKWYKSTENRLHNILFEKLGLTNKNDHITLCELINCRNYLAHPNEKQPYGCNLIKKPTSENIINWFGLLAVILKKIDTSLSIEEKLPNKKFQQKDK